MFFRKKRTPSGFTWQFLQSYRDRSGQPRQRILASLGCASLPLKELKAMARAIERNLLDRDCLFHDEISPIHLSVEAASWVDRIYRQIVRDGCFGYDSSVSSSSVSKPTSLPSPPSKPESVFVDQIEHTHDAILGPLLVAKAAWEELDLSSCLRKLGFSNNQITAAAASVMSRLIRPSSEYSLVQWIPTTALPELLGEHVLDFDHKYFYRISDKLLKYQSEIERHLRTRTCKLFTVERTILLYDLTNTYFEGLAERNPKARRGVSKEKRHDRPLIVLGVIYDGDGFALAHRTFAGNMNDGKSLAKMAQLLQESRFDNALGGEQEDLYEKRSLVVVDAGVATAKNLVMLRDAGFSYLVNDSRRERKRYYPEFADREAFEALPERRGKRNNKQPVEIRMLQELALEESGVGEEPRKKEVLDTILLCRSAGREKKEKAIFSRAEERFRIAVVKLDERLKKGMLKQQKKIQQAFGRLKAQHPRVQRYYTVELCDGSKPMSGLKWERNDRDYDENQDLFGCYALRTDRQDFSPQEIWQVYISLTQAEEGFRALKTDLGLRPNFHQKEERVDGHIFITVLAYQLWKWVRQKLDEAGDTRDWATVRRLLETHCYGTLIVPHADGSLQHIRKAGRAEIQQQDIYRKLRIETSQLPKSDRIMRPSR